MESGVHAFLEVAVGRSTLVNARGSSNSQATHDPPDRRIPLEPRISLITLGVSNLERSLAFYRDGLGFPTSSTVDQGVIFFRTSYTCLALYSFDDLVKDIAPGYAPERSKFGGITLAHNVRQREEVAELLAQAERAGAKIEKPAQDTFWGGHAGYFSDPDGYVWEIAWGAFPIREDGSLEIP